MLTRHRRKTLILFADVALASALTSTLTNSSFAGTADETPRTLTYTGLDADGDPIASGKSVTFTVDTTALLDAAACTVSVSPAEVADNGTDSATITTVLIDTDADYVPGWSAAANVLAATGSGNTVTQPAAASNRVGVQTGSIVSTVAATKTLSTTAGGLAVTDTASLVVSGTPSSFGFDNEPVGMTEQAFWNDEATLEAGGWTMDDGSSPGASGGTTTRVTSGLPDTAVVGGTAAIYSEQPGGAAGGNGPGRLDHYLADGTEDEFYFAMEAMNSAANTTSTASGGNKIALLYFADGQRYFINYDDGNMNGHWGVYQNGSTRLFEGTELVTYGQRFVVEWYLNRSGGAGAGIMQMWVNGVLALNETTVTIPTANMVRVYKEWTNNGNRTLSSPVTRVIGVAGGADTQQESWITAMKVSTR